MSELNRWLNAKNSEYQQTLSSLLGVGEVILPPFSWEQAILAPYVSDDLVQLDALPQQIDAAGVPKILYAESSHRGKNYTLLVPIVNDDNAISTMAIQDLLSHLDTLKKTVDPLYSAAAGELNKFIQVLAPLRASKYFRNTTTSLSALSNLILAAVHHRILMESNISKEAKIVAVTGLALEVSGSLAKFVSQLTLINRGLQSTTKLPIIGMVAGILSMLSSPLPFYLVVQDFLRANRLDSMTKEFAGNGYKGYQLLSNIYQSKATLAAGYKTISLVFGVAGGIASIAFSMSIVGASVLVPMVLLSASVSGLMNLTKQLILEKIASNGHGQIMAWEEKNPGENYFDHALRVTYDVMKSQHISSLQKIQTALGVEQVAAATQIYTDEHTRDLAAITKLTEKVQSGHAYIETFKNGVFETPQTISLDAEKGVIDLTTEAATQALVFTTPMLTPAVETHLRTREGKNKYITTLTLLTQNGWVVHDSGNTATTANFSKIIQRAKLRDGITRTVCVTANMGDADDCVIASEGPMIIDGGDGDDRVDYSAVSKNTSINVRVDADGKYFVEKYFSDAQIMEEEIKTSEHQYGKRREKLEYRDVVISSWSGSVIDTLSSVEMITGSLGDDRFVGADASDFFYGAGGADNLEGNGGSDILSGGEGDDQLRGGDGDDLLIGEAGNDQIQGDAGDDVIRQADDMDEDDIDGGNGFDIVDYSLDISSDKYLNASTSSNQGIKVIADLQAGQVIKYPVNLMLDENVYAQDRLKNIEGLVGSASDDDLHGDEQDNLLDGAEGADIIHGRGGNDTLIGGSGNDLYFFCSGDGQDRIYDVDTTFGNLDTLQFGAGITLGQLQLQRKGDDLELSFFGTGDKITIDRWYLGIAYRVEQLKFSNSFVLPHTLVDQLVEDMARYTPINDISSATTIANRYDSCFVDTPTKYDMVYSSY